MPSCLETSRIPTEIVLRSRLRILVEEPQADLPVIDDELRPGQLDRVEMVDDDCPTYSMRPYLEYGVGNCTDHKPRRKCRSVRFGGSLVIDRDQEIGARL